MIDLNDTLQRLLVVPADISAHRLFVVTALAQWTIWLAPLALLWSWARGDARDRRAGVAAGVSATCALAFAGVISSLYFYPRPFMVGAATNFLDHARDSSFPSDHASVLFALAASFALTPPRARWLAPLFLLVACAAGWARVALGAHYPFDILGGAALGGACATLIATRAGRSAVDALTRRGETLLRAAARTARRS